MTARSSEDRPGDGVLWARGLGSGLACLVFFCGALSTAAAVGREEPERERSAPPGTGDGGADAAVGSNMRGGIRLGQLLRLGFARNAEIAAARARWRAAVERYPQATALPDPAVTYGYYGESVETRVGPQRHRFGVSQAFPFPGTLQAAGSVALRQAAIQKLAYEKALRDFAVDLRLSYHELVYLQGAAAITRRNQELLTQILKVATTRHATGAATLNDVLKAQSQLAQLSYDLVLARELQEVEKAKIRALLDLPSSTPLGPAETPRLSSFGLSADEVEEAALAGRQELLMAAEEVEKAAAEARLAAFRTRPAFSLSAMTIETGEADMHDTEDSGKDPWLVGVGVSVPLWASSNRSRRREAELGRLAAAEDRRALESRTKAEVRSVYFRLQNARRLIELYDGSLLPQAEQAMATSAAWQQDRPTKDISGLLETQTTWLSFSLARLRAVADYQQVLARLERLAGRPLRDSPAEEAP